jgi:hypothetical protein
MYEGHGMPDYTCLLRVLFNLSYERPGKAEEMRELIKRLTSRTGKLIQAIKTKA